MAFAVRYGWMLVGMLAVGCSNSVDQAPTTGLDSKMPDNRGATADDSNGAGTNTTSQADACSVATSWQARDVKIDVTETTSDFADAVNTLVKGQSVPAISVSNHLAPHCVWMVAFSASDNTASGVDHAATYTEMFRHPAGLWTAAPQATGWIRVIDSASHTVWIPMANITGSASFGATDCSSISQGEASAMIPRSAASLSITTARGAATLGDLLGPKSSKDGWQIHFTFSAELAQ